MARAAQSLESLNSSSDCNGSGLAGGVPGRARRRRPLPGATLIPEGFESVAHQVFWPLRRPPSPLPPPPVPVKQEWVLPQQDQPAEQVQQSTREVLQDGTARSTYSGVESQDDRDGVTCVVCCGIFQNASTLVSCMHTFCYACITRWCETALNCPLCKSPCGWILVGGTGEERGKFRLVAIGYEVKALASKPWPERRALIQARDKQRLVDMELRRERSADDAASTSSGPVRRGARRTRGDRSAAGDAGLKDEVNAHVQSYAGGHLGARDKQTELSRLETELQSIEQEIVLHRKRLRV